jgi:hypothetical protein
MKKYIVSLVSICFILTIVRAQTSVDALRYSAIQYGGTARSMGVGNSMSILGGDFGTIGINPAGLATYRGSELTFSMGYLNSQTRSQLSSAAGTNGAFDGPNSKINFNNLGLVLSSQPYGSSKWKTGNFAIGLNKLSDFNREIFYQGTSPGSLMSVFRNQAAIGQWDDYGNVLAYDAEALFDSTIAGKLRYYSDFDNTPNALINRTQSVVSSGRATEMVISFAGNYEEKLSLGVTLGVPFVKYSVKNTYSEKDLEDKVKFFNNLSYSDGYTADGTGVNLKIGAAYRVHQMLRIGAAIHTPTMYDFSETRNADFTYNYTASGKTINNQEFSPEGVSEYNIITPWKFIGSAGFLAGKNGFLTADVEYVNYGSSKITFETPDTIGSQRINELKEYQSQLRDEIKATYKSAMNIRVGGEFAYDVFRLRGGVNLLGATLQSDSGFRTAYTLGFGLRGKKAFFDIAYRNDSQSFKYQPYTADEASRQPTVDVKNTVHNIVATVGFRF